MGHEWGDILSTTPYIRAVVLVVSSTSYIIVYIQIIMLCTYLSLTNKDALTTWLIETLEWLSDYVYRTYSVETYGCVCTTETLFLYRNQGRSIGQGDADGPTESKQ